MGEAREIFAGFLLKKNLRMTSQRDVILDVVSEGEGYFSAGELCDLVKVRHADIGRATVYRTLRLMAEAGVARVIDFSNGVVRYELAYGREHHDHLICERCRKSVKIMDLRVAEMQERLSERHGFKFMGYRTVIYGLCGNCEEG